jgi:hypothetical protein
MFGKRSKFGHGMAPATGQSLAESCQQKENEGVAFWKGNGKSQQ